MGRATQNAMRPKTARTRRRRTSTVTKAKYKPKTARANRSLIMSNAKAISMLRKMAPKPLYTDYQYGNLFEADFNQADNQVFCDTLSSPVLWRPCLRQDDNVLESSATYWRNFTLNFRVNLGLADWAQFSIFIITPRRDNNAFSFNPSDFAEGRQYVVGPSGLVAILNSQQFKVHAVRHISLTNNAWKLPLATFGAQNTIAAGNPETTFKKFQVNVRCKTRIRNPRTSAASTNQWKAMVDDEMPYYQRYHVLTIMRGGWSTVPAQGAPPTGIYWHQLNTCINTD